MTPVLPTLLLAAGAGLEEESLLRALAARFSDAAISYLLFEADSCRLAGGRWPADDAAVPAGSLVKPFLALAYGAAHNYEFPVVECRRGCWYPRGHGRIGLRQAIASSCNVYFAHLAARTGRAALAAVCARFRLPEPPPAASLIGLGDGWRIAPRELGRAYCELASAAGEPGVDAVLEGMRRAACEGTASAIGRDALAKTGTAPCSHSPKGGGDGFTVVLFPARRPVWLLLVRVHGVTGARAAETAAAMLHLIRLESQ